MGRYARGKYGTAKYGLDLWSEYSVETMRADLEVDPKYWGTSSFTNNNGQPNYRRVQVSWLEPSAVTEFRLMRSNLGFSTSPNDPFASKVFSYTVGTNHGDTVNRAEGDPANRRRLAYLDLNVDPGREYFYTVWVYILSADEWIRAGEVSVTTSNDHGTLDSLKSVLPAYMWNRYSGPGDGVAVMEDEDDENFIGRWLQSSGWELDKSLTKIDLLREVWDPQKTPSALLDDAVRTWGLPIEPALGARAQRSLLANAAEITGSRGSKESISLLVESLTGFNCPPLEPNSPSNPSNGGITIGKNVIGTTDESSFEGLMVANGTTNVIGGTGRWVFFNSTLTRVPGDIPDALVVTDVDKRVHIARDANADDDWGPSSRFGVQLNYIDASSAVTMQLGEAVVVTGYSADATYAEITTKWPSGVEPGDKLGLHLEGVDYIDLVVLSASTPFTFRVARSGPGLPASAASFAGAYINGKCLISYQGVLVNPGTVYSLVGKFKSANRSDISLRMTFYDRFGNIATSDAVPYGFVTATASAMTPPVVVPSATWTPIYIAAVAPDNAAVATLEIVQAPNGSGGQYLGVDSLMVAPGGTAYTPVGTVATFSVNNKVLTGNVATLSLSLPPVTLPDVAHHTLAVGDKFNVAGVGAPFDGVSDTGYWTVTAKTNTTVSYALTHANVTSTACGGSLSQVGAIFDSGLDYAGLFDYTFEDSRLVTITIDTTATPSGQPVPATVQADLLAVIQSRIVNILATYLPIGTAFVVKIVTA